MSSPKPLYALLMSSFVDGWGLVYVGRVKLAVGLTAGLCAIWVLFGILGWIATPVGLYVLFAISLLIKLAAMTMAVWIARKSPEPITVSRRTHNLCISAFVLIPGILIMLRSTVLGYELNHIASNSMAPTLETGEYIVSNTRYFSPKVGDLIIYRIENIQFIARIVAVGGDTLSIVNGSVINNGHDLGFFFASAASVKEPYSLTLAPLKLEAGQVYLLGDNRDNSNDSRFIGPISVADITGKVTGIWLSETWSRVGTTFD